jgi:hypothetical protein
MTTAQTLARRLSKAYGLRVVVALEPGYASDGQIRFEEFPDRHISVGALGSSVVLERPGGLLRFLPERRTLTDLFFDLAGSR